VRSAAIARDRRAVSEALHSVRPADLAVFFHASLARTDTAPPLTIGLPASPGAASGRIALSADEALAFSDRGDPVILVRRETTPDDMLGIQHAAGLLTCRGGMVSHAAVVARGWGIPAVVGAAEVVLGDGAVTIGDTVLRSGDFLTLDGGSGEIFAGSLVTTSQEAPPELDVLLAWADAVCAGHVDVRVNADTEGDASLGRRRGARGIGLCRTEHMFLSADRLALMRRFILSDDPTTDAAALGALEDAQTADFEAVLAEMDGLPVTVRLLDPPLHEFLPDPYDLVAREATGALDDEGRADLAAVRRLHEANPMLGTRGVRLGVTRSGVYEMQVRALCRAAANLFERGLSPRVELMVPLVVDAEELRIARTWVTGVLDEIGHPDLASDVVTVGAMIETPRAALVAGALAAHADFFSFGTNDLTQLTYAFSRDDVESRLLPAYRALGILPANPFEVLDPDGVGRLLAIAFEDARRAKPGIKLGVCGEHAGDPASAALLVGLGVDSMSCSPFRIPLARLGVAQALLACGRVDIDDVQFDFGPAADGSPDVDGPGNADVGPILEADEALVLHVLRVRGFVNADGFVDSIGSFPDLLLDELVADGLVRYAANRDLYALLPAGRERHRTLLDALAGRERLAVPYRAFLELNDALKTLCTRWQLRAGETNDHSDPDYDDACIAELGRISRTAESLIDDLAGAIPRMVRYRSRLHRASERVAAGDVAMFSGVGCGSFHDIWMELHEDLIVLQDLDREAEGSF
jgi:phosphoenolpyruvate-protein kinase (PTS system EI component)